jgi:23S rRNA-/tRNA-specific pseudouridylate synthase
MNIVYQDRWLVVVDKPSGLPTQATAKGQPGLVELLKQEIGPGITLHHRLDQPASGLVVFGAHPRSNKGLSQAFRDHTIRRDYRAVLSGVATSDTWTWDVGGKSARSGVTALGQAAGLTAVAVQLHTGRKHQIRVHAAMAGAPVMGDRRYGAEAGKAWPRLALHAASLALNHPISGERLAFEAPLPDGLATLWARAIG